jgi:hypothetical protein
VLHKTAIIDIRRRVGIPEEGLPNEKKALAWYREYFRRARGIEFNGTFGFHYNPFQGMFEFDYRSSRDKFSISVPYPLDHEVPLDREALSLAKKLNLPDWATPALRLVLLVGDPPEEMELRLPEHLIVPLRGYRILVHPAEELSLRPWRKIGEMMGLLPGERDMREVPGIITSYDSERENKKKWLYWQTLIAYSEAIGKRRMEKKRGKRGLLIETAEILKSEYDWEYLPDSYTIRRYLDRAQKRWRILFKMVETAESELLRGGSYGKNIAKFTRKS